MMNEGRLHLATFLSGLPDPDAWEPLPSEVDLRDLEPSLDLAPDVRGRDVLGSERREAAWLAAGSLAYEGGIVVWLDGDAVVALEGRDPISASGEAPLAPDFGTPEATLDTLLGDIILSNGEWVFASRGVALRVNPGNGLLLGVVAFAPTTADEYMRRIRPIPARPVIDRVDDLLGGNG
jgi:hypothetical protein